MDIFLQKESTETTDEKTREVLTMQEYLNRRKNIRKKEEEKWKLLTKTSLEMIRTYWKKYRQHKRRGRIFLSESGEAITVGAIGEHFRKYRRNRKY